MRIATWNVNSIRSRIVRVTSWLERRDVDVLAIQETKCREDQFPGLELDALGYEYAHVGLNQWNGVAIVSRVGIEDVQLGFEGMPEYGDPPAAEARAMGATCGGIRMWSLYVPNGRKVGDPHLDYKLRWLDALRAAHFEPVTDVAMAVRGALSRAGSDASLAVLPHGPQTIPYVTAPAAPG